VSQAPSGPSDVYNHEKPLFNGQIPPEI
jgi:hypothetical protein